MPETKPQTGLSPNPQEKVEKHPRWLELPAAEAVGQIGTDVGVFAVLAVLFALTSYMSNSYHSAQLTEAAKHFAAGNRLAAEGEDAAAIEHYRTALALLRAGRLEESQTHLQELLEADPTNGLANLAMARIAALEWHGDPLRRRDDRLDEAGDLGDQPPSQIAIAV